jgi:hypothetical protein
MKVPAALVVIPLILVAFYLWWLLGDWLYSKIKPHIEAWLWRRINRKKED